MKYYSQNALGYRVLLFSSTCALMVVNMWDVDFVSFHLILHSTDIGSLHLENINSLPVNYPVYALYRVSQEEWIKFRESVPYVKLYRYNPKHLYAKLNGYGDNGQRSLKLWQLLHTYWLPNTY